MWWQSWTAAVKGSFFALIFVIMQGPSVHAVEKICVFVVHKYSERGIFSLIHECAWQQSKTATVRGSFFLNSVYVVLCQIYNCHYCGYICSWHDMNMCLCGAWCGGSPRLPLWEFISHRIWYENAAFFVYLILRTSITWFDWLHPLHFSNPTLGHLFTCS
jgi:hypothetical protein